MTRRNQNLNLPGTGSSSSLFIGTSMLMVTLDNSATGSTEDTNARFIGPAVGQGSEPLASWVTVVTSAAAGSSFEILRSGIFLVEYSVEALGAIGSPAFNAAVTLDAPLATRQNDPLMSVAGVLATRWYSGGADAAAAGNMNMSVAVRITQTLATTAGLGIIRCGISNGLNATPTVANLQRPDCYVRITKIADLNDVD